MVKHEESWYVRRLQLYYDKHYSKFDDATEWYGNQNPNQWMFANYDIGMKVLLTCNEHGEIIEERSKI